MATILDFRLDRFDLFLIYKLPPYFLLRFESIGISVQERFEVDCQDGGHGGHLGF